MESSQRNKIIVIGIIALVVLIGVGLFAQRYRALIGARLLPVPDLSESIIGGQLIADNFEVGSHTLEFRAKTTDGKTVSDSVTFSVEGAQSENQPVVHISHFDSTNSNLKYASNASGSWVSAAIDELGDVGDASSLAVDSQGNIHISYHASPVDHDLKYATNASGSWVATTVDTAEVGQQTAIALDSQDNVYIVYRDNTSDSVNYITNASGNWVATPVPGTDPEASYCYSIVVDQQSKIHLSCAIYSSATSKQVVQYITNASGSWVVEEVDSPNSGSGYYYPHPSLRLDEEGAVHMTYYLPTTVSPDNRLLKYATNASGSWVQTVIDTAVDFSTSAGHTTSLALDSQGKVHISYFDEVPDALRYATNASGSWVTTTVDDDGFVGKYNSIAVDGNDDVHISYFDSNGILKYATNTSDQWVASVVDSDGSVGRSTSIGVSE